VVPDEYCQENTLHSDNHLLSSDEHKTKQETPLGNEVMTNEKLMY